MFAVIVVLALGASGYHFLKEPPKARYKSLKVERGDIVSTVSATGTLNAVVTVQVGTQVSGTVAKLFVDFNSPVRKGQTIAQIDPSLFASQVEQSTGNSLNAEATLAKARVTLADAQRTLGRNRQLLEQGIISQADLDAAQTAYDSAQAGVKAARAQVVQSSGALKQAQTNLRYATIKSPVDGIVVSRNVDVGQTVAASFQTPTLFTIAQDLTKMQIETSVDEADISRIKVGQSASFTVDAYPERKFAGEVTQIRNAPVVTQNVVTYVTVIAVDNKELLLKPGMTANVSIETTRRENVLKIPCAALRFKPKKEGDEKDLKKGAETPPVRKTAHAPAAAGGERPRQTVFVAGAEGKAKPLSVVTGISDNSFVELVEGNLKENDEVIVEQITEKKAAKMTSPMGPRF